MPRHRNSGSFKRGVTPWNKGTKGLSPANAGSFTSERSKGNRSAFKGNVAKANAGNHRAQKMFLASRCEECGDARKRPRWLIRHHRNGNTLDNRPENIQVLCRSCHPKIHYRGELRPIQPKKPKKPAKGKRSKPKT